MTVKIYKTDGTSMAPFLLKGDEIIVDTHPGLAFRVGDILLYRSQEHSSPVAHRLIKINLSKETWVLRSDAHPEAAEEISKDAVVGRVEYVKRNGKLIRMRGNRFLNFWNRLLVKIYPTLVRLKKFSFPFEKTT